jgi:hypothetical protein
MRLLFPAGGTVGFRFNCRRYNSATKVLVDQDISLATEVTAYLVNRNTPMSTLASQACSIGYAGADWENGVVTGAFDDSSTSLITTYGPANMVVRVVIAGEPEYFYSDDMAVDVVSVPD